MDWRQALREGATGVASHKLRAGLAILGITIGVGSVIAMVALGEGAKTYFTAEFDKLGASLVMVSPQTPDDGELRQGDGRVRPLTAEDGRRVFEASSHVAAWSAEVQERMALALHDGKSTDAEIHGVLPSYQPLRNFEVETGRLLDDRDLDEAAPVCVIGPEIRKALFSSEEDPVGKEIILSTAAEADPAGAGGLRFRVLGVLKPKGQVMWIDFDRFVLIPLTTAQRRLRGTDAVDMLLYQVAPGRDPNRAQFEAETLLSRLHRGTPDFRVRQQAEFRESMERTLSVFQYFIGGIAGVSLMVGGIGIMNIMLISVLERTREIGIRMAIGARRGHILGQFLTEAMVIGATGGVGGLILGPLLGLGVAQILTVAFKMETPWRSVASPWAALGALVFSLAVGIASGFYPALKASRLDPVEALRHE